MNVFLIIIAAIIAVIIILLAIPFRLEATYENDEIINQASAILKYGFIKYKIYPKKVSKNPDADEEKTNEKEENAENEEKEPFSFEKKKADIARYLNIFEKIKNDAQKTLSYASRHAVVFEKVDFHSEFGFEDAMQTGIFTGIYNGFVYTVMGVIHQNSTLKEMDIKLQPVFGKKCFNNRIFCILRIKTAHIIIIAFKVLMIYIKIKKLLIEAPPAGVGTR